MALRDVPRSMPTWRTSFFLLMSTPFGGRMVPRLRVREDPLREGPRDLLTIRGVPEMARLVLVRDRRHLREDARHLRADEDDEGRASHATVLEAGHDRAERGHEPSLHGFGEFPRLALRSEERRVGKESRSR